MAYIDDSELRDMSIAELQEETDRVIEELNSNDQSIDRLFLLDYLQTLDDLIHLKEQCFSD
jgi:hypothetical protein